VEKGIRVIVKEAFNNYRRGDEIKEPTEMENALKKFPKHVIKLNNSQSKEGK